ncbi:MAG TPA: TetR/AcrR family transcriptional regulator [Ktedonobacterales bacterium]
MSIPPRRTRRPRGSLTRPRVVEAALRLADEEGLEALTMPGLARRLDCGVMTIYGYVDSRDDLLDAIAAAGLANLRLPRPLPAEPAAVLVLWGRALRETLIEHPCLPVIFLARAVIGQAIFRGIEALLAALGRAGMPAAVGVRAIYAVVIYTTGFAAWEQPRTVRQPASDYAMAWRREFASLPADDYPLTSGVLDELARVAGAEQFELGLAALASGLAGRAPGLGDAPGGTRDGGRSTSTE